jgi:regulator of protease activity HflC (stomatin/prohibitin superfamily)
MDEKQIKWAIGLGVPFVVIVILSLMSITVVNAGHIGVATTFGAVEESNYEEGMVVHAPWRSIVEIDTRVSLVTVECMAASSDLQSIQTTISANFYPAIGRASSLSLLFKSLSRQSPQNTLLKI